MLALWGSLAVRLLILSQGTNGVAHHSDKTVQFCTDLSAGQSSLIGPSWMRNNLYFCTLEKSYSYVFKGVWHIKDRPGSRAILRLSQIVPRFFMLFIRGIRSIWSIAHLNWHFINSLPDPDQYFSVGTTCFLLKKKKSQAWSWGDGSVGRTVCCTSLGTSVWILSIYVKTRRGGTGL